MTVYYKYPFKEDYIVSLLVVGDILFTKDGLNFKSGGRGYLIPYNRIVKVVSEC